MTARRVPSSFRDPAGFVLLKDTTALRVLSAVGTANYEAAVSCGLIDELTASGALLPTTRLNDCSPTEFGGEQNGCVLEQPRLPFVSYPYEWCFDELKAAALLHLDIQRTALRHAFELSDATAYNIQFVGHRPVFIDIGSFVPRRTVGYWRGYRQFCEQFLNPLLLQTEVGVPFNDWYRGRARGIPTEQFALMLRAPKRLKPRIYLHVVLHARMIARTDTDAAQTGEGTMSDAKMDYFLASLRDWIASLSPPKLKSAWADYTRMRTYAPAELEKKLAYVKKWTTDWRPNAVLDLGTNTGEAALLAASLKTSNVVGVELDAVAANIAYNQARQRDLPVLPLVIDLTNPSPSQGWQNQEWSSFYDRCRAETVYALAILHHLVLGGGIPLDQAVARIVSLGKQGIIEFVPPNDPMAASIRNRVRNCAIDYSKDSFLAALKRVADIVGQDVVTDTGRCLYAFEKK
jgi:hypothetical protein